MCLNGINKTWQRVKRWIFYVLIHETEEKIIVKHWDVEIVSRFFLGLCFLSRANMHSHSHLWWEFEGMLSGKTRFVYSIHLLFSMRCWMRCVLSIVRAIKHHLTIFLIVCLRLDGFFLRCFWCICLHMKSYRSSDRDQNNYLQMINAKRSVICEWRCFFARVFFSMLVVYLLSNVNVA